MKRSIVILSICCLLAFCACQKSGINAFRGDYSFKTSGDVTVQRLQLPFDTVTHPAFTFHLPNDIGQLQINTLDRDNDSVIVVMNHFNGQVVVAHGRCDGQELTLKEFQRNDLILSIEGNLDLKSNLKIRATGHIYDDNTLILNMSYRGRANAGILFYDIEGNDIKMVATRN